MKCNKKASDVELFANVPSSIIAQAKPLAWYNEEKGFTKELIVSIDEDSLLMKHEVSKRSLSASGTSPKKNDYDIFNSKVSEVRLPLFNQSIKQKEDFVKFMNSTGAKLF